MERVVFTNVEALQLAKDGTPKPAEGKPPECGRSTMSMTPLLR